MPSMENIGLGMCIKYGLDGNNIRISLMMINKMPECTLTQLSRLDLGKYDC